MVDGPLPSMSSSSKIPSHRLPTVVVITPTIGSKHLARCISSVAKQDYRLVEHLVVVDGPEHYGAVAGLVGHASTDRRRLLPIQVLPFNTGCNRYKGYRICVAYSLLVNADFVFFLDDDNWYDNSHLSSCLKVMKHFGTDWAFALRRICKENGDHLIDDDCDSIGYWRRDASYRGPADLLDAKFIDFYSSYPFLIDTSCFAMKRTFLTKVAPLLLEGDCYFSTALIREFPGACSGLRTVNYRSREADESRLLDYFSRGNASVHKRYIGVLPWLTARHCSPITLRRTGLETTSSKNKIPERDGPQIRYPPRIPSHPDRPN